MRSDSIFYYYDTTKIYASGVGADNRLGVCGILDMFQDYATAHSAHLGIDGDVLRDKYSAFWIVTKHRLHIYSQPKYLDTLTGETWVRPRAKITVDRCYRFTDDRGHLMVEGRSEWAVLDLSRHTIRRLDSTPYPTEENDIDDSPLAYPYLNIRYTPEKSELVYSHTVRSSDIDMSAHTNNVSYARMMMNAFDCEFFKTHDITDFEIAYRHESTEGSVIDIYRHDEASRSILACVSPDGTVYSAAEIKYRNK